MCVLGKSFLLALFLVVVVERWGYGQPRKRVFIEYLEKSRTWSNTMPKGMGTTKARFSLWCLEETSSGGSQEGVRLGPRGETYMRWRGLGIAPVPGFRQSWATRSHHIRVAVLKECFQRLMDHRSEGFVFRGEAPLILADPGTAPAINKFTWKKIYPPLIVHKKREVFQ